MNKLTVFGSYVMDLTTFSPHIPVVGETVFAGPFKMGPGGKGFNQAVAARKAGANVRFMTKIGKDLFGPFVKDAFERFDISRDFLMESDDAATGTALIIVDKNNGNNAIAVAPGACNELTVEDVRSHIEIFTSCDVFLTQFESNLDATYEAIKLAKSSGALVLLNPAPVKEFDHGVLKYVDMIIPNEIEASLITGISLDGLDSIADIATKLRESTEEVIITLGEKGVYCPSVAEHIMPAYRVKTIDTTGAGDAFAGVFASYLSRGEKLERCINFARAGAAISTTRIGTSPSMPTKEEIELLAREHEGSIRE